MGRGSVDQQRMPIAAGRADGRVLVYVLARADGALAPLSPPAPAMAPWPCAVTLPSASALRATPEEALERWGVWHGWPVRLFEAVADPVVLSEDAAARKAVRVDIIGEVPVTLALGPRGPEIERLLTDLGDPAYVTAPKPHPTTVAALLAAHLAALAPYGAPAFSAVGPLADGAPIVSRHLLAIQRLSSDPSVSGDRAAPLVRIAEGRLRAALPALTKAGASERDTYRFEVMRLAMLTLRHLCSDRDGPWLPLLDLARRGVILLSVADDGVCTVERVGAL